MKKILTFFVVSFFIAVWIGSFAFWWHCVQTTESTVSDYTLSFIAVIVINILFDIFAFATWDLMQRAAAASDKIIDKLLK